MTEPVVIKLRAAPIPRDRLPRIFESGERSANPPADDPFLPRGLLSVGDAYDLQSVSRAGVGNQRELIASDDQVVVLELPEGVTVITHPHNLRDALRRIDPQSVAIDGTIAFDHALGSRTAALRGSLGDAIAQGLGGIVSRVYTLGVGRAGDPIIEAAVRKLCEWLGEKLENKIEHYAELGVSWLGTKALMWAIESRLKREPGLYRWHDGQLVDPFEAGSSALTASAEAGPLLVLIHGAGSSTAGTFDTLRGGSHAYWKAFEDRYGDRVLAFEHHTASEGPAQNALQLVRTLPTGATLHLLTHSRGGLVGDLLCIDNLDALAESYAVDGSQFAESDPIERQRVEAELRKAHAEQRKALHELAAELKRKKLRVERYVRVASPARGTRLASGNFDVFLSAMLSLMGWIPALHGNPIYSAFKRVVLEVARNRTRANLVPGIEAMLPGSPLSRLLASAAVQQGMKLAVISGDIEGGGWLERLPVLFTDFTFFDSCDNDLIVDTDSMTAGVARPQNTRVLFDRGPEVNHFRYFVNDATRLALRGWLIDPSLESVESFKPLRGVQEAQTAGPRAPRLRAAAVAQATTIFLPGIMGSQLWRHHHREHVWFDVASLADGGLAHLKMKPGASKDAIEAEAVSGQLYGALIKHLESTQHVVPFAYDWRQPLDVLADRFAALLRHQLDASNGPLQPLRVLAHSMGGLVVRALIHRQPALWDEFMARDGARFVMLGTPHQGSHLMVETLLGKADTVRRLGILDLAHDLQQVLDIVASFPGALQLLPKPGFVDTGDERSTDYFDPAIWSAFKTEMRDRWFGDGIGALPTPQVLKQGQWLWTLDGPSRPALPARHEKKVAYVFGCAAKTPCGISREGGQWKMLGTPLGDGAVTWESGRIDGIGRFFYMPAEHGALADTEAYFDSIAGLLDHGEGGQLMTCPPAVRDAQALVSVASYDAGPALYPTPAELAAGLFGTGRQLQARERLQEVLNVRVKAMDLRQVTQPILVGHYEQDAISGPEALIDRDVVHGELTVRHHLGLYAGAIGTASAVLLHSSPQERQRGSLRGAVVTGLGKYDGSLTVSKLTEAVRTAGLRYLVHLLDSGTVAAGTEAKEKVKLASLLLGYNSSANLTIADSVQAVLRGIVEANQHFGETTSSKLRIDCLDIVEVYLDSAITATYAARQIAQTMNADKRTGCRIAVGPLLHQGEGMRQRLFDGRGGSYWPRLMISDADRDQETSAADAIDRPSASRLHYLYVGQRARAESMLQQRQPGLVETLVDRQVMSMRFDADFSRTLFQLLVPHDFKDAARQMQQIVFVLDSCTANLPWELMAADDQPLATRVAMVRQLSSTTFRTRVNQTMERRSYVLGNPSTEGFAKTFPDPLLAGATALGELPAAEQEAEGVAETLVRHGFEVECAIGNQQRALEVMNRLYKHPYRIVHVAGHGIYEPPVGETDFEHDPKSGRGRSGVVLSDGLLIGAAEIDAMEVVPDLVFLNCCHLGRIERSPVPFNKLAHSVARQLIDIGVRAVVVAGWAVEDDAAGLFAQTFYDKLLGENLPFGDAVFQARRATWERHPTSITWGAYQAYGDPSWRIDPKIDLPSTHAQSGAGSVAPEELLDQIDCERQIVQRSGEIISEVEAARLAAKVQQWLDAIPSDWDCRPDLHSAIADLYSDLGPSYLDKACAHYEHAVVASDRSGKVPIRAIEQWAHVEARLGEEMSDAAMVARGIARLEHLVRLTGGTLPGEQARESLARERSQEANPERTGLLGASWKRKAAVHARCYLATAKRREFDLMIEALGHSSAAYLSMASALGDTEIRPYPTLNWLFLWSLTAQAEERRLYLPHVLRCAAAANAAFIEEPQAYNSTMVADAALVTALLSDSLLAARHGAAALNQLVDDYEDALQTALVTPRERDSVVKQIRLMALFHHAHEKYRRVAAASSVGRRLDMLADRLSSQGAVPNTADGPPMGRVVKARSTLAKKPTRTPRKTAVVRQTPAAARSVSKRSMRAKR